MVANHPLVGLISEKDSEFFNKSCTLAECSISVQQLYVVSRFLTFPANHVTLRMQETGPTINSPGTSNHWQI